MQSLAYQGIPEEMKSLRPLIWKILLHYLPNNTNEWLETLRMNRENYETIRNELLIKPQVDAQEDHPLSIKEESKWNLYFADQEVWEEINKDIKRTRPDMSFFFMPRDNDITPE